VTEERKAAFDAYSKQLVDTLALGHVGDYNEVNNLYKKAVYIRDDIIKIIIDMLDEEGVKYIGAATEAKAQCVALEQ
jgi:5'-3' exonuclease